ncbi:MAG: polysaccharide pyruvyl transferase family protein [candidate division KSB1 bacterium]|nr:polysaccharide pyruvyl transferase family protein [candidate division KSB1 bacterium]
MIKTIAVLGNFSGRNAGDAAILGCLLRDLSTRFKRIRFLIPTIRPDFVIKSFSIYPLKPVGLLPWNFSVKIFGLPILRTVLKSDLVLVTDAILFDRKLYNPLFNYLWTLSHVLPLAHKRGIPVVLYNASLGPIRTRAGKRALARVLAASDLLILRDQESIDLLNRLGLEHPHIVEGADCALNAEAVGEGRFQEICKAEGLFQSDRPVIGFNINSYVDAFVRRGASFGKQSLVEVYAATIDRVIEELDVDAILVETQHMDLAIAQEVLQRIRHKDRVKLISNKKYSYQEICSVLRRLELFVGMRTHSLILSSAMGVVPVGIVTYPKNRGFMRTLGLEENLIEFGELSTEKFTELILSVYHRREEIKEKMIPRLLREKAKAREAVGRLIPYLRGY